MLTTRLKDDNWALHQIAERQETPGSLIKGTMPRGGYEGMLAQQVLVNRAMDRAMVGALASDDRFGGLVLEEQMLTPYLHEDASFLGIDCDGIVANPGTARFVGHIEAHADRPLHLLGLHYVRLGACNGNRFVARVVRKAYGLGEEGTRYLDPFGEAQRGKWMAFKRALDALPLREDEQDEVFGGTRAAYVASINLDLDEAMSADALLEKHGKTLDKKAFEDGHSVHVPATQG